jgi:translation initiation factor IF-3
MHAVDFLCEDMKVKVALKFRGREMAHTEIGFDVINKFLSQVGPYGHPDFQPKLNGRNIVVMITPLPRNKRAKNPRKLDESDAPEKNYEPHTASPSAPKKDKNHHVPTGQNSAGHKTGGFANNPFANIEVKSPETA